MKKFWEKLSALTHYYIKSMLSFFLFWGLLTFFKIDFMNNIFFVMAFIWHFALMTPGLKEKVMISKQRYSFLSVAVRINYYLQLFIKITKYPFGPSIVRAISPFVFTALLLVAGGNGNIFFTVLGSVCFEFSYYFLNKKISKPSILMPLDDQEIPPAIPNAENFHE